VRLTSATGIITPYTSFLITEDDIFSQRGVEQAQTMFEAEAAFDAAPPSGQFAVDAAESAPGCRRQAPDGRADPQQRGRSGR
jgi:hypothetical protein